VKAIFKRLRSKTYWLGIATLLLGALETAQATGIAPQMFGNEMRAAITVSLAVAIFLLRELTTGKVDDK
jgi:hypothetical protein